MPSHMSDIGFPMEREEDYRQLATLALEKGEALETANGVYVKWSPDEQVELWVLMDQDETIVGLSPHFSGSARMRVALTERVSRPDGGALEGAFRGWADPRGDHPESGDYQFVFDVPDYDLNRAVALPSVLDVQLAAFAHELEAYESNEAYKTAQGDVGKKIAPESFLPVGLWTPRGELVDVPEAYAILTGHVLETSIITNPITDSDFCWARIRTLGGELDMVADPLMLNGFLVKGGIISGSFWLSGRLPDRAR